MFVGMQLELSYTGVVLLRQVQVFAELQKAPAGQSALRTHAPPTFTLPAPPATLPDDAVAWPLHGCSKETNTTAATIAADLIGVETRD